MARIDILLDELERRGATSLHITPGFAPHARIGGELAPAGDAALTAGEIEEMLLEVAPLDRASPSSASRAAFVHARDGGARYRVTVFRGSTGLGAVLRAIPARVTSLVELRGPDVLRQVAERRAGLVIVAGPRGRGAPRTAAALVDHVNAKRACHVLTIEDPIDVVHAPLRALVSQREVGTHAPSWEAALDGALREDADVVLVSELSQPGVARRAVELASEGVLVIGCVVASSVAHAIERVVDAASPGDSLRGSLADALVGAVAERVLPGAERADVFAHEVLLGSPAAADAIRGGLPSELAAVMMSSSAEGMQTLDMALEGLVHAGRITPETALEYAADGDAFARAVGRGSRAEAPS